MTQQYTQEFKNALRKTITQPAYLLSLTTSTGTLYITTAGRSITYEGNLYIPGKFKVRNLVIAGGGYDAALEFTVPSNTVNTPTLLGDIDGGIMSTKLCIIYDEDEAKTAQLFVGYVVGASSFGKDITLSASASQFLMTPINLCNTIWDVEMPASDQEFSKVGTNFSIT